MLGHVDDAFGARRVRFECGTEGSVSSGAILNGRCRRRRSAAALPPSRSAAAAAAALLRRTEFNAILIEASDPAEALKPVRNRSL